MKSNRQFPHDFAFIFGSHFSLITVGLLAGLIVPLANSTIKGDPTLLAVACLGSLIGCVLLFLAKLPLYKKGVFFTMGRSMLPSRSRRLYCAAYFFILPSIALLILIYLVLR